MDDLAEEPEYTFEEVKARIAQAQAKKAAAKVQPRQTDARRELEARQRNGRVNQAMLRGRAEARDEAWTIRVTKAHKKAVTSLAKRLSVPRARVSIADIMSQAIELVLAKYKEEGSRDA